MNTYNKKLIGLDRFFVIVFCAVIVAIIFCTFSTYRLIALSQKDGNDILNPYTSYINGLTIVLVTISLLYFHYRKKFVSRLTGLGKVLFLFSLYLFFSCIYIVIHIVK